MKNSAKYLFGDHLCACPTLCIPKIDKELITLIIDLDKNVNSFRMLFTFVVRTELINKMIFLALDYFKSNTAPFFSHTTNILPIEAQEEENTSKISFQLFLQIYVCVMHNKCTENFIPSHSRLFLLLIRSKALRQVFQIVQILFSGA